MRFYLGTHKAHWLAKAGVPLFISRRTLAPRKTLPRATAPWALDSGGFTELNKHGKWETGPETYAKEVRRFRDEIGMMDWAAPQDWMCEEKVLQKTGLSVRHHQMYTLLNYVTLLNLDPGLPWIPVLQGWTMGDYLDHVEMYLKAGVDLSKAPVVGVGSVCRRQATIRTSLLMTWLADEGLKLHGFGVKISGLRVYRQHMASADSLAWSYNARRNPPLPECRHKSCANCMRYALQWREKHGLGETCTTDKTPLRPWPESWSR